MMFARGYVAARSAHTRGSAVDLTLHRLADGQLAPMGGAPQGGDAGALLGG